MILDVYEALECSFHMVNSGSNRIVVLVAAAVGELTHDVDNNMQVSRQSGQLRHGIVRPSCTCLDVSNGNNSNAIITNWHFFDVTITPMYDFSYLSYYASTVVVKIRER